MELSEAHVRVFLAVAIPERAKMAAGAFMDAHHNLSVRWTEPENLHVTVLFIGWTDSGAVAIITERTRAAAASFAAPPITFTHFDWAPPRTTPRMIWLYGESDETWSSWKDRLRRAFAHEPINHVTDERPFTPHVTIARFRQKPRKTLSDIRTPFEETFTPKELLLMKSTVSRSGPTYTIMERFVFRDANAQSSTTRKTQNSKSEF